MTATYTATAVSPGGRRRELFRVGDGPPDGMCADRGGNLWNWNPAL